MEKIKSIACFLRVFAHALPLIILILMANWMGYHLTSYTKTGEVIKVTDLSGFAWKKGDGKVFNWHPLLMTFGFVFCSTQAALVYISLPFSHETNKIIHATLHLIGFVSAVIGIVAVFRFHNEHNITNLYSLHSWMGILTLVLFGTQYLWSFMAFVAPGAKRQVRRNSMPLHIGLGLSILALVFVTVASGILEKLSFNASCNLSGTFVSTGDSSEQVQSFMAQDCVLGNIIGLLTGFALVSVIGTIWYARHQVVSGSLAVAGEREPLMYTTNVET